MRVATAPIVGRPCGGQVQHQQQSKERGLEYQPAVLYYEPHVILQENTDDEPPRYFHGLVTQGAEIYIWVVSQKGFT